MRLVGSSQIDVKTNFVLFQVKANDPAVRNEVVGFADRQNRSGSESLQERLLAAWLMPAEKQDIATLRLRGPIENAHMQHMLSNNLALNCVTHLCAPGLAVEHAKDDRLTGPAHGSGRPLHQLREMKDKGCLYPVLLGFALGRKTLRQSRNAYKKANRKQQANRPASVAGCGPERPDPRSTTQHSPPA
ncbi:MAG TPA: hypothetical protein VGS02_16185 [Acidobacteriaceae bacterium]|nr:hypothetical protein [Acidobacteriaceae bacterium]